MNEIPDKDPIYDAMVEHHAQECHDEVLRTLALESGFDVVIKDGFAVGFSCEVYNDQNDIMSKYTFLLSRVDDMWSNANG